MNLQIISGYIAIILSLISFVPYVFGIFKATVKPHFFTWFIWGVTTSIIAFAQFKDGAGIGAMVTAVNTLCVIAIAIFAIWRGTRDIKRSDWIVLFLALFAIPLWQMTDNPMWSVILLTLIDAAGFYPTFRKSYSAPEQETVSLYALAIGVTFFSALSLAQVTITTAMYPVTLFWVNFAMVLFLVWRRKKIVKLV